MACLITVGGGGGGVFWEGVAVHVKHCRADRRAAEQHGQRGADGRSQSFKVGASLEGIVI